MSTETGLAADKYSSDSQQRLLTLVMVLAGNEMDGLAPSQVAKAAECSPSQVTRDLANLKHAGWAEQVAATGRWRLGPAPVQLALRHMAVLDRAERRLTELKSRFSANTALDTRAG